MSWKQEGPADAILVWKVDAFEIKLLVIQLGGQVPPPALPSFMFSQRDQDDSHLGHHSQSLGV